VTVGVLFDTHTLLWWLDGDRRLPANDSRAWTSPCSMRSEPAGFQDRIATPSPGC
jgi:hypothetical protein